MGPLVLFLALVACSGDTTTDATPADSATTTGLDDTGTTGTDCAETWYADSDGDGFGDPDAATVEACEDPGADWVGNDRDCDDSDPAVWPGAADASCDGVDQDCDLAIDEDAGALVVLYADSDDDGFGDPATTLESCEAAVEGYTDNAQDCDDTRHGVNPAQSETCNDGLDNDCDGQAEECRLSGVTLTDRGDAFIVGEERYTYLGSTLAGVGDLNGDGYDDVAMGADGDAYYWYGAERQGLYIAYGPLDATTTLGDMARLTQPQEDHYLGVGLADIGDLDGDGYDDLVAGSPGQIWSSSGPGAVFFHSGAVADGDDLTSFGAVYGDDDYGSLGMALGGGSDLTGDGVGTVVVGAPLGGQTGRGYDGAAYLIAGFIDDEQTTQDFTRLQGESGVGAWFGQVVADLGDTDGDGHSDLLISGSQGYDGGLNGRGRAYLFLGPLAGDTDAADADVVFEGPYDYAYLGSDLAAAGDLDGDGYRDMLLGAFGCHTSGSGCDYRGSTLVVHGPADPSQPFATKSSTITGDDAYDQLGWAVDGDFDADGDGTPDVLLGAWQASDESRGSQYGGTTYLFHGPVVGGLDAADADLSVHGAESYEYSGFEVAGLGDHDGDGLDDFGIGVVGHSASEEWSSEGAVAIFNGSGL